jgi:biopolymer transport protein ExbB/TolQ
LVLGIGVVMAIRSRIMLGHVIPVTLPDALRDKLHQLDVEAARVLCVRSPSPLARIVTAALDRIFEGEMDVNSVERTLEDACREELSRLAAAIDHVGAAAATAAIAGFATSILALGIELPQVTSGANPDAVLPPVLLASAIGILAGLALLLAHHFQRTKLSLEAARLQRLAGELLDILAGAARRAHAN